MNRIGSTKRRKGPQATAALLLWGLMATGCVYDPDEPCGKDLVVSDDGFTCGCPKGTIFSPQGCTKCGKNEVAGATSCSCKEGYSRASAGAACTKTPDMPDPVPPDGDGGMTTDESPVDTDEPMSCTDSSDCTAPAQCRVSTGECVPYPTGLKDPCTSAADCEGKEAGFCNLGFSNVCEVNMCDVAANNCFPGFHCCDVSALSIPDPLCIEEMYPCP